jgi:hypothetical protein
MRGVGSLDGGDGPLHALRWWGIVGGTVALVFAVWMLLLPDTIPTRFAWDIHPDPALAFIGAGYVFRTAFFYWIVLERRWSVVRWMFVGNLVFTGTLLLASYWHAEEFLWGQFLPPTAHLWLVFYVFEPVTMVYLVPRGAGATSTPPMPGGPLLRPFRWFLVIECGLLLMLGLLLVINPAFADQRWPWDLNDLDARMIAAWFLGWSAWTLTMALAEDWDEVRMPAILNVLNGLALLGAAIATWDGFRTEELPTPVWYVTGLVTLTVLMAVFVVQHERRRPTRAGLP